MCGSQLGGPRRVCRRRGSRTRLERAGDAPPRAKAPPGINRARSGWGLFGYLLLFAFRLLVALGGRSYFRLILIIRVVDPDLLAARWALVDAPDAAHACQALVGGNRKGERCQGLACVSPREGRRSRGLGRARSAGSAFKVGVVPATTRLPACLLLKRPCENAPWTFESVVAWRAQNIYLTQKIYHILGLFTPGGGLC